MNKQKCKKICYIKTGDVASEVESVVSSNDIIEGGHLYYIDSVYRLLSSTNEILFISFHDTSKTVHFGRSSAYVIKTNINKFFIFKLFGYLKPSIVLIKKLINNRPDYIFCTRIRFLIVAYIYCILFKKPLTVSIHTNLNHTNNLLYQTIEHYIFFKAHKLICHGPFLKNQLHKIVKNHTKIIEYNASCRDMVNLSAELPETIECHRNNNIITYIGRMEFNKGIYDLYDACKYIFKQANNWVLYFAGSGPETQAMRRRIQDDNLVDKVILFGALQRGQIAELLRHTWVAVTPTRKEFPEGRCMAAMEALALGVPVVAPDYGPFPYLVKDNFNGLLYKANSLESLKEALLLITDRDIRNRLAHNATNDSQQFVTTNLTYRNAIHKCLTDIFPDYYE